MKNSKLISKLIAVLFFGLILAPNLNAGEFNNDTNLEIVYNGTTGNTYYTSLKLNNEQIQKFRDIWEEWENYLKIIREDKEMDLLETINFEKKSIILIEEIKNLTKDSNTNQTYFPDNIEISSFIHSHLFAIGLGPKIFSIGRGSVWLPFNRQGEAFIGSRFNPIFISHSIGFTKVKVRSLSTFSMVISNRFFLHRICIAGFSGLYINFGKLFPDTSIGPVILIGKPLLLWVGDDIF